VKQYLREKLEKHKILLTFIEKVTKVGFSREAHKMLKGSAILRLNPEVRPKRRILHRMMTTVDDAHLLTWLRCVGAKTLDNALPEPDREHLFASLDLPPSSEALVHSP